MFHRWMTTGRPAATPAQVWARTGTGLIGVLLILLMCAPAVPATADGGQADSDVHVAQTLGSRELTIILRRVGPVLGPLAIDVVSHHGDAPGTLQLTATAPGAESSTGRLTLGPVPGMYSTALTVDQPGPWELLIDDGHTVARIPFLIPARIVSPSKELSDYAFFAAGAFLVASLAVALWSRGSWAALVPAAATVIAGTVAITAAVLSASSPPPPQAGRDVDPTLAGVRDPYARVPADSLVPVDYSRPPLNLLVSQTPGPGGSVLHLAVVDSATGRPADDVLIHHGALMHLIVVSPRGAMVHLHPVRVAPGRYEVLLEQPDRGTYAMAAEVARRGGGIQLLHASVDAANPIAPVASSSPESDVDSGHVEVVVAKVGQPSVVHARFGQAADLQPWLGMVGHMMVVGPLDGNPDRGGAALAAPIWSHAHAMVPPTPGATGAGPDETVARYGPVIEFTYTFALPGRYAVWVQTERDFTILTASADVEVPSP